MPRQLVTFSISGGTVTFASATMTRSADGDVLAVHARVRASSGERLKVGRVQLAHASSSGFFHDGPCQRMLGVGLDCSGWRSAVELDSGLPGAAAIPVTLPASRV